MKVQQSRPFFSQNICLLAFLQFHLLKASDDENQLDEAIQFIFIILFFYLSENFLTLK